MTRMLDLKGMPKHYFKSLLGTCPYKLVRLPHSQLVSQVLPVFPHMTHQFLIYSDNQIVAIRWVFYYLISISFFQFSVPTDITEAYKVGDGRYANKFFTIVAV